MNRPHLKSGCLTTLLFWLVIGCIPPVVVPIVPIPDPVNPIVVVPAVEGQRVVLLLHESMAQTPAFAQLIVEMRTGANETYIASKGHSVYVLDIDSKDADGKPLDVITRLKPKIGDKTLPVLVVAEKASGGKLGKVLSCESLPPAAVANEVMAAIKKAGG